MIRRGVLLSAALLAACVLAGFLTGPAGADRRDPAVAADAWVPGPAGEEWVLPGDRDPEAARVMQALARAYPARVTVAAQRDGDWAVLVDGAWFYWATGRLLPEGLRSQWASFAPYRFYRYPAELPTVPLPDPLVRARLAERVVRNAASPPHRHEGFLSQLYQARTRAETEARLVEAKFSGLRVRVHGSVAGPLEEVGRDLERLSGEDPEIRAFLGSLKGLAGFNWRSIDGTRSRSYHGYGAAVDLVPRSYGGRQVYWRWTMENDEDWYAVPYSHRWMVPAAVTRAFEARGFVWGGKWLFFDTMHFEYRPEVLLLSQ